MLNPNYPKVSIENDCPYMIDSGAFQDVKGIRKTYADALSRQLNLESRIGRMCESLVSYDRLVDEQIAGNGEQVKKRVDEETGNQYVEETVNAARFLAEHEHELYPRKLVMSCQGVTVDQYMQCAEDIIDIMWNCHHKHIFGIGGFCILSKSKQYKVDYLQIIDHLFPMLSDSGIDKVHIFGMSVFDVLIRTEQAANKWGIDVTYDTSSAEINSVFGRVFCPESAQIKNVWNKDEKYSLYHPTNIAHLNILNITQFWENYSKILDNGE